MFLLFESLSYPLRYGNGVHNILSMITLTTDFGLADEYVGVMKGVILSRAPETRIVDISHGIPAHDIHRAAGILRAAYAYFPKGTIHVVVVDPGVGGTRKIILVRAAGHLFLAPDNGVLSPFLTNDSFEAAHAVECEEFFLKPTSNTFHGRDIMAPVAAHLATGLAASKVGTSLKRQSLVQLAAPATTLDAGGQTINGAVTGVDHFGNLLTNIHYDDFLKFTPYNIDGDWQATVKITIKDQTLTGLKKSYAEVAAGELLILFGSRGFLEIAANRDSAARRLAAGPGEKVILSLKESR